MATRSLPADHCADEVGEGAGRINDHQLTVLAASLADVVQLAGGWLFDQARAGWDVDVWVPGRFDRRPLTILGAGCLDGDSGSVLRDVPHTGALAVTADLPRVDPDVRALVLESARRATSEVTVLGAWPAELGGPVDPAEHRLSVAARAFKALALSAASVAGDVIATETLYEVRAEALRPLYPV
ncbi:hypothetical protein ABGB19_03580 [Mycobacterium sp. B14F4]|uniref:hypothetical protein n=1 Tax=Mycobacterium sp. B14F4 TaxID=3153565 RepID=UPI00325E2D1F